MVGTILSEANGREGRELKIAIAIISHPSEGEAHAKAPPPPMEPREDEHPLGDDPFSVFHVVLL